MILVLIKPNTKTNPIVKKTTHPARGIGMGVLG